MGDVVNAQKRLDLTESDYHGDPCARPSLSSSIAKVLLDKSPLHAWHRHPRLGKGDREESKVFDAGRLGHKLLLGKGADVVRVDAGDWRKKAAQEERDAAYEAGKIPVLDADYLEAEAAVAAIVRSLGRKGIVLDGESEVPILWEETVSGHDNVLARGMLDHLCVSKRGATIFDVKTSRSAHPRACSAHVVEYGYDIQRAAYVRAVEALYPEIRGRVDFVHLFVELDAPHAVTPGRVDGVLRERGERRWARAVEVWAECLAFGTWPDYADRIITIEAPPWALSQLQETDR